MATTSSTITLQTEANSGFVSSLKPLDDELQALVAAGVLGQAPDSGQVSGPTGIGWNNVSPTNSTTTYYSIYYLNDSLHSTYPIYIKFFWVPSATNTNSPTASFGIGTGTTGSGAMTGATSTSWTFFHVAGANTSVDTTARPIFASAGEGYLTMFGGVNPTEGQLSPAAHGLAIERTRNLDGTINGDGITVAGAFSAHTTSSSLVRVGGTTVSMGIGTPVVGGCFAAMRDSLAGLFGNGIWPPVMLHGEFRVFDPMFDGVNNLSIAINPYAGKLLQPMTALQLGSSNFPTNSNVNLTINGQSHTYRTLNSNLPAAVPITGVNWAGLSGGGNNYTVVSAGYLMPLWRYE